MLRAMGTRFLTVGKEVQPGKGRARMTLWCWVGMGSTGLKSRFAYIDREINVDVNLSVCLCVSVCLYTYFLALSTVKAWEHTTPVTVTTPTIQVLVTDHLH